MVLCSPLCGANPGSDELNSEPLQKNRKKKEMFYFIYLFFNYFCLFVLNAFYYPRSNLAMFYLTTHLRHFILRLYGVRHMVKDHSDSKRGNLQSTHGLLE